MMETNVLSRTRVDHVLNMAGSFTRDFNCWGATMFISQAKDRLGWVDNPDISQWLQENFEPIKRKDLREGDVLALFQKVSPTDMTLIHTAVYVGESKYVHKIGQRQAQLDSLTGVLKHYAMSTSAYTLMRRVHNED